MSVGVLCQVSVHMCLWLLCSDLVIGAYESRQVFVLRSRTVVVIDTNIISSTTRISITSDSEKMCLLGGVRYNW